MRKYFNIPIIGLVLIALGFSSCDREQEVSDPISPDGYPLATYTLDKTSVSEGDTFNVIITMDKMDIKPILFTVTQVGGDADYSDFDNYDEDIVVDIEMAEYQNTISVPFYVALDDLPEATETIQFEIGAYDVGSRYQLNPSQEVGLLEVTITNVNDAGGLTIALGWTTPDDDIDFFGIYNDADDVLGGGAGENYDWFLAGSSANPEVIFFESLTLAEDPDYGNPGGMYYFGIDPYFVEGTSFDYTISVGYPDQTVEFFTGTFDMNAIDTYTVDYFAYWGVNSYRMIEVVFDDTDETFSVSHVHP